MNEVNEVKELTALVEKEIGDVFREADGHPRCEIVCKYVRRVLERALAAKAPWQLAAAPVSDGLPDNPDHYGLERGQKI